MWKLDATARDFFTDYSFYFSIQYLFTTLNYDFPVDILLLGALKNNLEA